MLNRKAFYIPQDKFGKTISMYTGLFCWGSRPTCHEEFGVYITEPLLEYINKISKGDFKQEMPYSVGWWYYSSTSRNRTDSNKKSNGTRWIKEKDLFKHPERWFVYEGKAIRPIKDIIKDSKDFLGCAYDWLGIAGFLTPFGKLNAKAKWYCSEICQRLFSGKWWKRWAPRQDEKYTRKVLEWRRIRNFIS